LDLSDLGQLDTLVLFPWLIENGGGLVDAALSEERCGLTIFVQFGRSRISSAYNRINARIEKFISFSLFIGPLFVSVGLLLLIKDLIGSKPDLILLVIFKNGAP
jgi:hypothetical protein